MSEETPQAFREFEFVEACPLCAYTERSQRFQADIWQCGKCQLLYRNPRPSKNEIFRFYNIGSTYEQWQNELDIRTVLWDKRLQLLKRYKKSGELLDIGTGDGFFLIGASSCFSVCSTEISESGAEYARKRGFSPLIGNFEGIEFGDRKFDVITLWHVLEHMLQPGVVLGKIGNLLRPDGIVAIAVPNERYQLLLKQRDKNPLGALKWGEEIHLIHFVPSTLKRALEQYGFKVVGFGVDDVHVRRTLSTRICYLANKGVNALLGWHFDKAMFVIAQLA